MMKKSDEKKQMSLEELPQLGRSIMLENGFFISDTLDSPDVQDLLGMSGLLERTPFKIRFSMFLVCEYGYMKVRLGMKEYTISKSDMLIAHEGAIGELIDISPGICVFMIAFSKEFCMNGSDVDIKSIPDFLTDLASVQVISLTSPEMLHLKNIYGLLRFRLEDPAFHSYRQLAIDCLHFIYSFISCHLESHRSLLVHPRTRGEELLKGFLSLVEEFSATHRDLDFYSDRLCVSSKYLSKVISQSSGMSARHWICMRVIMEAKVLLKERTLTIEQVSDRLNFSNQSFFGTFFKRHVGMSPMEYRAHLRN